MVYQIRPGNEKELYRNSTGFWFFNLRSPVHKFKFGDFAC